MVSRAAVSNAGSQLSSQQSQNIEGRSNNNSNQEQYEEHGRMVSRTAVTNAGKSIIESTKSKY